MENIDDMFSKLRKLKKQRSSSGPLDNNDALGDVEQRAQPQAFNDEEQNGIGTDRALLNDDEVDVGPQEQPQQDDLRSASYKSNFQETRTAHYNPQDEAMATLAKTLMIPPPRPQQVQRRF